MPGSTGAQKPLCLWLTGNSKNLCTGPQTQSRTFDYPENFEIKDESLHCLHLALSCGHQAKDRSRGRLAFPDWAGQMPGPLEELQSGLALEAESALFHPFFGKSRCIPAKTKEGQSGKITAKKRK